MNLGKEGPLVHVASCVANVLTRFFPKFDTNDAKRREILSSASSAGVAVAFGSPIAGVLFSLEEVSYFFPPKVLWRSFFCAAVAAVSLKVLNPHGTGKLVLLETNFSRDWHTIELPIFAFIGVMGGLYGALFCYLNLAWSRGFRKMSLVIQHPILEVIFVVLISTFIGFWNPYTKQGGTELVDELLTECIATKHSDLCPSTVLDYKPIMISLGLALLSKIGLTIITFGIKLPAGIFVPTMAIGALFGKSRQSV